ncbi:MAG: CBS domain-containing protein [Chloroflexi bacterium]|nr:CBS domain-containing protein [Chloroflexota bacterium]
MQLREVMTPEVDGVRPDASLSEALEKLKAHEGEPLPVFDDERLVGMVTEHEVVEWGSSSRIDPRTATVRDVMRRDVAYVYDDQDIRDAARLMNEKHVEGLIVLRRDGARGGGRPVGTISAADLASTITSSRPDAAGGPQTRVVLRPIAAPSILGLYGLAGATLIVAAHQAGLFGGPSSPTLLFPFAALFGGLAQFLAGMWSYRARDGLATAMHGMWGAFWMAYGVLFLLVATGSLAVPSGAFPEIGWWLIAMAAITWVGTIAAAAENWILTGVLGFLAAGSTVSAGGFLAGNTGTLQVGGWLLIISAVIAWYLASAMMLAGTYKRAIVPLGRYRVLQTHSGPDELGEPGVKAGQ